MRTETRPYGDKKKPNYSTRNSEQTLSHWAVHQSQPNVLKVYLVIVSAANPECAEWLITAQYDSRLRFTPWAQPEAYKKISHVNDEDFLTHFIYDVKIKQ